MLACSKAITPLHEQGRERTKFSAHASRIPKWHLLRFFCEVVSLSASLPVHLDLFMVMSVFAVPDLTSDGWLRRTASVVVSGGGKEGISQIPNYHPGGKRRLATPTTHNKFLHAPANPKKYTWWLPPPYRYQRVGVSLPDIRWQITLWALTGHIKTKYYCSSFA